MNTLLEAANQYIDFGLSVIALTGKAPNVRVHPHGLYDAFGSQHNQMAVAEAFAHPETTGVGILTGMPYYVVDIDGEGGLQNWVNLVRDNERFPPGWVATTGRGLHIYYSSPREWPTRKLAPELDFKGKGGYVAAPPSKHPDGRTYAWERPPDGLPAPMPGNLLATLVSRDSERTQTNITRAAFKRAREWSPDDPFRLTSDPTVGPFKALEAAGEGNRNNLLFWAAMVLAEEGGDAEDYDHLYDIALERGLTRQEVTSTIRSAQRKVGYSE